MIEPLLHTKLLIPQLRPNIVSRPRLVERLNVGITGPLTLISAPAGYGKTTLIGEWRSGPGAGVPVAWLSLDSGEDDPARLLLYLVSALDTLQPGLMTYARLMLQSPQPSPVEPVLTVIINGLSGFTQDFVVALDDFHAINTPETHQLLVFLLDHLPPQMHLVILTRADPPLSLARFRARNQLVEIRAKDLQFTTEEAFAFLNDVMALNISAADIRTLLERTEGWIAGLQLAALAIRGREDPSNIIATFGGGYHYVVDFLVEEVLNLQPDHIRMFLLQTSILSRLSGPLCTALTGQIGGEATLQQLEQANLFVLPLDGECCWYRYHHLFADVMRNRLRQMYRDQIPELHHRAAKWYEQNDFIAEAIEHALAARDWEYAGSLMDRYSLIAWRSGEITRILEWAGQLPEKVVFTRSRLCINYGWACALTGRYEACENALAQIEPLIQDNLEAQIDWLTVQVFLARARGKQARAVELAKKARDLPEIGNVETRALLMLSLTIALWDLGRIKEVVSAAEEATQLAEQARNWHARAIMLSFSGLAQAALGNLHLAKEFYQQVTREVPTIPAWVGGGFAQVCLSALFYEWNDLIRAKEYAYVGLEYSQLTGHSELQMNCYRQLAFIYQAQGNSQKAWGILNQAEQIVQKHYLPRLWGPEHVQIALAQKDLVKAQHWIEKVQGEYGASIHYPAIPLERAKLILAQGDKSKAATHLAQYYRNASQDGIRYAQIEIRILQALASFDEELAMNFLSEALAWAKPEGFVRIFVDQGQALIPLLRTAAQRGIYPSYVVRLLSAMEAISGSTPSRTQPLTDPLSDRELKVLQLVAAGKSNQEIADELVIAIGTVKRHIYNIFGKLNVRSRTQCATRARELRLLQ